MTELQRVAEDVWAWVRPGRGWGWSNAGVVGGRGQALLVDTLYDLRLTRQLLTAAVKVLDGRPITDAVNTHANGDHCFGNELLGADVRIHAARETVPGMHEAPPHYMAAILKADLGPVLTPYMQKAFGPFAFEEITLREPDSLFDGSHTLDIGGRTVHLHDLGPAHTEADTVVHVPDAGVLFTGDLLFVESTPIMWAGPSRTWIAACDRMIAMDPEVVVPGHGPVTGQDGILAMRGYLEHAFEHAKAAHARGESIEEAGLGFDTGPYAGWENPERIVITMHALYREIDPAQPVVDPVTIFQRMAEWDRRRNPVSAAGA
ncbi:MBL fold metallo-hydrolase [Allokutzneria albata]|uniref:Glyoxylase, beta-lactamase superfamily II n=1 Tax=Allokutzneria albata TaxID=211114 RepID=A0A1G9UZE8_ALLAB|nr:MBL fold metallo-hydrolase [Allokutzneria albata]SDM65324.1 Glyoxylase, beta-lactamase superfamily II [Allokutzneria albata]